MNKVLGIIGGMGPLASIDLQRKIVENTWAQKDQDHLHVITDSYAQIPDRTEAILHAGADPLSKLIESAERLAGAGANLLLIACNTAHHYLSALEASVSVPFLSMIWCAAEEAKKRGASRVCVFSTTGTHATGLYEKSLEEKGMEVLELTEEDRDLLMRIIYGVKAGEMEEGVEEMKELLTRKRREGAELFFLACTELPIYFQAHSFAGDFLDPTEVLAREAILWAGGKLVL